MSPGRGCPWEGSPSMAARAQNLIASSSYLQGFSSYEEPKEDQGTGRKRSDVCAGLDSRS
eukprot:1454781-Ditylum_brightwellii.AAC.1